jgi:hypothetical protein
MQNSLQKQSAVKGETLPLLVYHSFAEFTLD